MEHTVWAYPVILLFTEPRQTLYLCGGYSLNLWDDSRAQYNQLKSEQLAKDGCGEGRITGVRNCAFFIRLL
jgi:hypothetical protein